MTTSTTPHAPPTTPWTESEQDYLLSLVPTPLGTWSQWDYVAASMMNRFGPMRMYNGPVVRAQYDALRGQSDPDAGAAPPSPNHCYQDDRGEDPAVTPTHGPDASSTDTTTQAPGPVGAEVRILDRIGPQMEYRYVPKNRLFTESDPNYADPIHDPSLYHVPSTALPNNSGAATSLPAAFPKPEARTAPDLKPNVNPRPLYTSSSRPPPNSFGAGDDWGSVVRKNYTKWTPEEEQFLQQIVRDHPNDWDRIVQLMHQRFPHGRTYTVGSLKKKIQYVPVSRNVPETWFRSGNVAMVPLGQYFTQPPPPPPASSEPITTRNEYPRYEVETRADSTRRPPTGVVRPEPSRIRTEAARPFADFSSSVLVPDTTTTCMQQPPATTTAEPVSTMSEDEIVATAIARVVPDLGLLGIDPNFLIQDPSMFWLSSDHDPSLQGTAGGFNVPLDATFPDSAMPDSIMDLPAADINDAACYNECDGDGTGAEMLPAGYVTDGSGNSCYSPEQGGVYPDTSTDLPTWRRWLHKFSTLKTALGVP